jgi:diguanylate cyclase (GGDEF)-like protein/PAS domain S-box-containing protein
MLVATKDKSTDFSSSRGGLDPLPKRISKEQLIKEAEEKVMRDSNLHDTIDAPYSVSKTQKIVHDLSVHQVELELQNIELKRLYAKLEETQLRYFDLYDTAPEGYFILADNGTILEVNATASKMLGRPKAALLKETITKFFHMEDQDSFYLYHRKLINTKQPQEVEVRVKSNHKDFIWMRLKLSLSHNDDLDNYRIILSDINSQKESLMALEESERKFKSLFSNMNQGLALFGARKNATNTHTDYYFLDVNTSFEGLYHVERAMVLGKSVTQLNDSIYDCVYNVLNKVQETGHSSYHEHCIEAFDKHFSFYTYIPKDNQIAVLISDITDRVIRDKDISYLNFHDQLTGVYNRRFYEEELSRLDQLRNHPISLIMGDINGLKLVNDSFGHMTGDKLIIAVAQAIQVGCRTDDIIARIGGDEFVVILPNTDASEAKAVIERIQTYACEKIIASVEVSVSFGYDTKNNLDDDILNVFRNAENMMYKEKLYETASHKSQMIQLIMHTLFEKNPRERYHSDRVSQLCEEIARSMKLSNTLIKQVKTAGLVHDIGKIAISESILNKKGKLTDEELVEMKSHPEISYRILSSSPDMSDLATCILEHHERWDGNGYPKGIKGENITLIARIITVADAFDAMTAERSYKNSLTTEEAIKELNKCAGTQFDPTIVPVFNELYEKGLL